MGLYKGDNQLEIGNRKKKKTKKKKKKGEEDLQDK